jgi:hypothetical protein
MDFVSSGAGEGRICMHTARVTGGPKNRVVEKANYSIELTFFKTLTKYFLYTGIRSRLGHDYTYQGVPKSD